MAEARRLSNLGVLGLVVRDQPTLRSALDALVRHVHLHNEAMTVTVEESRGLVTIQEEMAGVGGSLTRQAIEMSMTTTFRILSLFLGSRANFALVESGDSQEFINERVYPH
jgi:hypothetical protein